MSVEVNLVGTRCGAQAGGLSCTYCYQAPVRRGDGNAGGPPVDHEAIQRAVVATGCKDFSVFGGEPLLAAVEDLERLWAWGLARFGKNGVQTSGRPITPVHLRLFSKYRVHVGFSIDGPRDLNAARVAGDTRATLAATAHSIAMLEECLAWGIGCSLIITLSKHNAEGNRLEQLVAWLRELAGKGLRHARLHVLELDGPARQIALTHEQNEAAMLACHALEADTPLRFDVFKDLRLLLKAEDRNATTCVFNGCDPMTTTAVQGIGADGTRYMCERVHKDGRRWQPGPPGAQVRSLVLASTPQEEGGCQGCRFLIACKGQCPGTAERGDWRRRSRDCELWKRLFTRVEEELASQGELPVSLSPLLPLWTARMKLAWAAGWAASVQDVVEGKVVQMPGAANGHGDVPHGDSHGDEHGDSHGDSREVEK